MGLSANLTEKAEFSFKLGSVFLSDETESYVYQLFMLESNKLANLLVLFLSVFC